MKKIIAFGLLLLIYGPGSLTAGDIEKRVKKPVTEAITIEQKTQKEEEAWRLLQEKMAAELDSLQGVVDHLTGVKAKLREEVDLSRSRVDEKKRQLSEIKRIDEEMSPYLSDLLAQMSALPEKHLPFLQDERLKRIDRLTTSLHDPEVSLSEKYRKAMEALQIEAEYGLTIESSQEVIDIEGQEMLVTIFRLGRLGLYYVTLDESKCGFYNLATGAWQLLPDQYVGQLQTAVAIAEKRRPVEFIDMPLGKLGKPGKAEGPGSLSAERKVLQ